MGGDKMREEVCRNCKYGTIYYCKRHAPIIKGDDHIGRWPGITDWQDWCGDWEKKKEVKDKMMYVSREPE